MTVSQSSSLIRISRPSLVTPALATSTSIGPPSFSSASVNAASTDAVSVTSQRTPTRPSGASPDRWVTATWSPACGERPGDRQADAAVAAGDEDGAWLAHAVEPSGLPLGSRSRATYSGRVSTTRHHHDVQSVTSAPEARTEDQVRRLKQYLFTMAIRTICFVLLVVIDAWYRWIFAAGAVFLPFFAVVAANAVMPAGDRAGAPRAARGRPDASDHPRTGRRLGRLSHRSLTSAGRAARSRPSRCRGRTSWPTSPR